MLVIQTGGTIDKDYPQNFLGYAFEIGESAAKRIIDIGCNGWKPSFISAFKKDSTEITNDDRLELLNLILNYDCSQIIITHGTDTLLETGRFLQSKLSLDPETQTKTVVLTGALLPEKFRDSDAHFNFGMATAAVQILKSGVYVAMHGTVCDVRECTRDPQTGRFIKSQEKQIINQTPQPSPVPVQQINQEQKNDQKQEQKQEQVLSLLSGNTSWKKDNGGHFKLKSATWEETDASGNTSFNFEWIRDQIYQPSPTSPATTGVVLHDISRKMNVLLTPETSYWCVGTLKDANWNELTNGNWEEVSTDLSKDIPQTEEDLAQLPKLTDEQLKDLKDRNLPEIVRAKNFREVEGFYLPFIGKHICFLIHVTHALKIKNDENEEKEKEKEKERPLLKPEIMKTLVDAFDRIYEWYADVTGEVPIKLSLFENKLPIYCLKGKSQIGACCAWVGLTGIEMSDWCWLNLYEGWHNHNQIDQALPYEFGRNFLFPNIAKKLNYIAPDSTHAMSTGYAVFMRFKCLQDCNFAGGVFRNRPYEEFVNSVRQLLQTYCETEQSWESTLKVGKCFENPLGLSECDLWASFMLTICELSDNNFLKRFYQQVKLRPDAQTSLDAVDNLVICASIASNQNLTSVFQEWKWPVSDQAVATIIQRIQ